MKKKFIIVLEPNNSANILNYIKANNLYPYKKNTW